MPAYKIRNTVLYRSQNYATTASPFLYYPDAQPFLKIIAKNNFGPLAICAWEIRNNQLILSHGEFWIDDGDNDRKFVSMHEIFGARRDIPANWYSGTMDLEPIPRDGVVLSMDFSLGKLIAHRRFRQGCEILS